MEIKNPQVTLKSENSVNIQIHNNSDINYELVADKNLAEVSFPSNITLEANKTVVLRVSGKMKDLNASKKIVLPYVVKNLLIKPEKGLPVELKLDIQFQPDI